MPNTRIFSGSRSRRSCSTTIRRGCTIIRRVRATSPFNPPAALPAQPTISATPCRKPRARPRSPATAPPHPHLPRPSAATPAGTDPFAAPPAANATRARRKLLAAAARRHRCARCGHQFEGRRTRSSRSVEISAAQRRAEYSRQAAEPRTAGVLVPAADRPHRRSPAKPRPRISRPGLPRRNPSCSPTAPKNCACL